MEKIFKAYLCQMFGKYAKTKSEIMEQYQQDHIIFFCILNCKSWDFEPLLGKPNPNLIDSFLDNPNSLIGNVSAQPLSKGKPQAESLLVAGSTF